MTDDQAKEYGQWLKTTGQSTSAKPQKAVQQACGKLWLEKRKTGYCLLVDHDTEGPTEKDLPIICEAVRITGTPTDVWVHNEDRTLHIWYDVEKDGKPKIREYMTSESSDVLGNICHLPIKVLITLLGVHPCLDALIKRKMSETKGDTPCRTSS